MCARIAQLPYRFQHEIVAHMIKCWKPINNGIQKFRAPQLKQGPRRTSPHGCRGIFQRRD